MQDCMQISEKKLAKLAKRISKSFLIHEEEAFEIIYEEWELVERLFEEHKKVKAVYTHMIENINYTYRIA